MTTRWPRCRFRASGRATARPRWRPVQHGHGAGRPRRRRRPRRRLRQAVDDAPRPAADDRARARRPAPREYVPLDVTLLLCAQPGIDAGRASATGCWPSCGPAATPARLVPSRPAELRRRRPPRRPARVRAGHPRRARGKATVFRPLGDTRRPGRPGRDPLGRTKRRPPRRRPRRTEHGTLDVSVIGLDADAAPFVDRRRGQHLGDAVSRPPRPAPGALHRRAPHALP